MPYPARSGLKRGSIMRKTGVLYAVAIFLLALAVTVAIIWAMFALVFPGLFSLVRRGDEAGIAAYLEAEGAWKGAVCLFFISAVQVVSVFIPGWAIQVAAAFIYGWWEAFFICLGGFLFGNGLVFWFARDVGRRMTTALPSSRALGWLVEKINSAHPAFAVALANMMPGLPNGIVPYVASQAHIRISRYMLAVAASCWIQILLNCLAGHFLVRGAYLFVMLSFGAQFILLVIVAKNRDLFMKIVNRIN